MARTHQAGYMEAKAVKLLNHAWKYLYSSRPFYIATIEDAQRRDDLLYAREIVNEAREEARRVQEIMRQQLRGY